jgi:type IV secretory pathway VirB9-like protein
MFDLNSSRNIRSVIFQPAVLVSVYLLSSVVSLVFQNNHSIWTDRKSMETESLKTILILAGTGC